jgi:alkylhydroperoxidase family enzyme
MDLFARPTATASRLNPWLAELGRTASGLLDAFGPGHGAIAPRSRERVALAVTEVNGCRYTAWIHGAWCDFLGDDQGDEVLPVMLDFARDSALAGAPLDVDELAASLHPDAIRAVRATVAVAEVSSLVGNTADGLWERLRLRRPLRPAAALRETMIVAAAVPLAAPLFVAAGAMRLATWAAPPMPEIVQPPDAEANLVVHILSEAVPQYLANAVVRASVLRLPGPLSIGVRAEGTEATVRIERDRVELTNGLAEDTFLVIDGGLELLLDVATRTLSRELTQLTRGRR